MPDWSSRLAVSFDSGNGPVIITPIDSFSPTFALAAEALHSIERTHIGAIYSPQGITFTMTTKAIGDIPGRLTKLAMDGTPFDIILQEGEGTDWSYSTVVLRRCIITSCVPSNAAITGAPTSTFSGFSLQAEVDAKAEADLATIP